MSGGKTSCKPGTNPKDIKRHERRKLRAERQLAAGRLEADIDGHIHNLVEKATTEALGDLEGDVITEEMVAQVEVRLRSSLSNVVDEVSQVVRQVLGESCRGLTR